MSDEHKRQTEYWARAAADAGWKVELERSLDTGTRPDALIHGPVTTGIEVQRSAMTASRAVTRTSKAAKAGVADLWFSGRDGSPRWAWRVPTVLPRELDIDRPLDSLETWAIVPPRRTVAAAGLRKLEAVKCAVGKIDRCPYGRTWCGRYHPRPVPWRGLAVDDVAARFPAGEITALRFYGVTMAKTRRRDAIFLVSPADFARYEEMTGWSGTAAFDPNSEDLPPRTPGQPVECRNEQPLLAIKRPGVWRIDPQTPMWCDSCEQVHAVLEHRDCRATGNG